MEDDFDGLKEGRTLPLKESLPLRTTLDFAEPAEATLTTIRDPRAGAIDVKASVATDPSKDPSGGVWVGGYFISKEDLGSSGSC
jgi:hypothetical protein